jgi:CMP-N,N'-diacetyllegionaminic acid synthase
LALIPARRGSKGVPGKNIYPVAGKPLLAWSIEAATACPSVHRVIVSTEDNEIARIALEFGAEVPFRRPAELARDDSSSVDVIVQAVDWLARHEQYRPEFVLLLQPTSPLRTSTDISTAIDLALEKQANGVASVSLVKHHPYWMKQINEDGVLVDFNRTPDLVRPYRRQDLPELYLPNGAIYLTRRETIVGAHSLYADRTYAYVMPPERSVDIDSFLDLRLAELLLRESKR